jgi:hypothetical protein
VVDENGSPVAGARVTAAIPQPLPARPIDKAADTSDAAGLFHLDLPAEGEYALTAEHEGFFPSRLASVTLQADTPLEVHLNHVDELNQSVQVHYATPIVDPEQTSEVKRLTEEELRNAPVVNSQDYRSSLPLMPGVVNDNSGKPHFNGARPAQTNYRLNGFNISNPVSGELTTRLNVDAVSAIEWDASRFAPDRGKGSAGTLDLRTRMGDDHWSFGGTNFVPGIGTQGGAHLNHWSPRLMFSGPLKKGRGWFHNAFDVFYVADTVDGLPSGENRANSISGSNLTRLQWNVRENQILTGSFLLNIDHSRRVGLSILNPAETTVDRWQSLLFGTVKDQFLIGRGLLEVGFATTRARFRGSPQGNEPYTITPFGASGNFFRNDDQRSGRQEWLVNGFLKPVSWHGTHQFAVGADVERTDLTEDVIRHELTVSRVDGSPVRDVRFIGNQRRAQALLEVFTYVKDRWNPTSALTLDLGFRTQWDKYSGGAPPAPRLAAAWAPKKLNGAKLSAGWGVFYDPLTLRNLSRNQEQFSVSTFYSPSGAALGPPIQTRYALNPRDLRLARFTLASVSVEKAVAGNIYGRISLSAREGSRGPTFVQNTLNYPLNEYVLENVERQRYRSAEFAARGTLAGKMQWFASYTRSSARSSAVVAYSIELPLLAQQTGGPLDWDSPHRILTRGWMPLPNTWLPHALRGLIGDTDFQFLSDYRTGFPFTVTTEAGRIVGEPNSTRFPSYFSLNIALERKFPLRGYLWAFRAGLINALDRSNPNVVNSDFDSPQFMTFGRGQPRAVNVRLRFVGRK